MDTKNYYLFPNGTEKIRKQRCFLLTFLGIDLIEELNYSKWNRDIFPNGTEKMQVLIPALIFFETGAIIVINTTPRMWRDKTIEKEYRPLEKEKIKSIKSFEEKGRKIAFLFKGFFYC